MCYKRNMQKYTDTLFAKDGVSPEINTN
jgi:hypothetical protein